jgi:hypothetical protein
MNDLTKDELTEILGWGVSLLIHLKHMKVNMTLMDKIKSMINDYCDHENSGQDYSCNRCWDCDECW